MTEDKIISEEEINYKQLWQEQKKHAAMWERAFDDASEGHQATINKLLATRKDLEKMLRRLK